MINDQKGYISFVRGENPYTFPYRIYPSEFATDNTFPAIKYPSYQMNLKKIGHEDKKRILSLYLTKIGQCNNCGKCQYCCYKYIREMPNFENMESFGYTLLQNPLESLIISYPNDNLKKALKDITKESSSTSSSSSQSSTSSSSSQSSKGGKNTSSNLEIESVLEPLSSSENEIVLDPKDLTGKKGLNRIMNFIDENSPPKKGSYEYKQSTLDKYGKIFSKELIGQYDLKYILF